jgi:vitamin B12 transporter
MGAVMWNARWLEPWRARLQLARTRHESHASVNRAAPRRFDTDSTQIDWRNELALTAEQTLLLGLHSLQQKVDSTVAYARTQRRTNSATVGYNAHFGRHQWQANVRHDDISDIGGATTYLIGAGINMTETVRLTATRSTAFNAPTFNQLFFPGFGNPNLRPERARSSEVGVQYAADTVLARVVWFRTRYTDLIVFAPPTFAPLNVARAQVEGVELSASAELAGVRLRVSATDQRPINEDTGETLRRRAHRFGSLSAEREFAAWRLGVHVVSVGPRPDGAVTLGSYTLLHVNAGRRLANDLWLTVRVTNATDERYSTAFGYNAPRREGFIGLAWRQ